MRLSTRGRYAVMAMVEMAIRERGGTCCMGGRPVSLAEIASAQLLSVAYLEQLFARLRRAGLVGSARGPGGGYRLARPASTIHVAEVIEAVDEPLTATRCEDGGAGCHGGQKCRTHDLWEELGQQIQLFLAHTSLADIVDGKVLGRAVPPLPADSVPASPDAWIDPGCAQAACPDATTTDAA